jgi:hypothetical protein
MAKPIFIGTNTQDEAGAYNLTFSIDPSAQAGDLLLAVVKQSENTSGRTWDDDGGGGNGWIRIAYNRTTGGRDMESAVYYKIHSGSESNPTFTWGISGQGYNSEPMSGALSVYRGVDQTEPIGDIAYANAQNDPNPPNPTVTIGTADSIVACFHAATHDDISAPAPPTGYTMRAQVWAGTANDHRNIFFADSGSLEVSVGAYSPPGWQHSALNTTPEYHTYSLTIQPARASGIDDVDGDNELNNGQSGVQVNGFGFGSIKASGTLSYSIDYSTDVASYIEIPTSSWGDDEIIFNVPSNIVDVIIYIYVINDDGDIAFKSVSIGESFRTFWNQTNPDGYWEFNENYFDSVGRVGTANSAPVGNPIFTADPGCLLSTHSVLTTGTADKRECQDSPYTNITTQHQFRNVGCFLKVDRFFKAPVGFWEEGGGVNNLYFIIGYGNKLLANVADSSGSPEFKVQAISSLPILPERWYHVMMELRCGDGFYLWIDGIKQPLTIGNPIVDTTMSAHSGDFCFFAPDGPLDTGGNDIRYFTSPGIKLDNFGTWSDLGGGSPMAPQTIRNFTEKGALSGINIQSDTIENMQADLDTYIGQLRLNEQCSLSIFPILDDFGLEISGSLNVGISYNKLTSIQIRYWGAENLEIVPTNGAEIDPLKIATPKGGLVSIANTFSITINGIPLNAEWRLGIKDPNPRALYSTELSGEESNTNSSSIIYSYKYIQDEDLILQVLADGFKEKIIDITLSNSDQQVDVILDVNNNE